MNSDNPRKLPGYLKKSFALPYAGGEIWFEHLDGIYSNGDLVLEKLSADLPNFSRPSAPSFICFVFNETNVAEKIICAVSAALLDTKKKFRKACFVGLNRKACKAFSSQLSKGAFILGFAGGLEEAKEWLI